MNCEKSLRVLLAMLIARDGCKLLKKLVEQRDLNLYKGGGVKKSEGVQLHPRFGLTMNGWQESRQIYT